MVIGDPDRPGTPIHVGMCKLRRQRMCIIVA